MFKVNNKKRYKKTHEHEAFFIFLSGLSFTGTDNSQDSRGREGTIFYSTLPLPPAHEHSDIYLQLRKWNDYHIFSIAMLAFTRRLLDEIYHRIIIWLIDLMLIFVHLLVDLILAFSNGVRKYVQLTNFTDAFSLVYVPNSSPKCKGKK